MGDMADAVLSGEFCQWCGEYLGEGDGFAVICAACEADDKEEGGQNARSDRNDCK